MHLETIINIFKKNHKKHTYFIKKSEKKLKIIKKLFAFRGKVWYNQAKVLCASRKEEKAWKINQIRRGCIFCRPCSFWAYLWSIPWWTFLSTPLRRDTTLPLRPSLGWGDITTATSSATPTFCRR